MAAFRLVSTTAPIATYSSAACCVPAAFSVEFAETQYSSVSQRRQYTNSQSLPLQSGHIVTTYSMCRSSKSSLIAAAFIFSVIAAAEGHVYLMEPVSRNFYYTTAFQGA